MAREPGRHRVAGLVAAAVTLAALLAGCAGIPTSGPVVAGPEVGLAEPDFAFNALGPQDGATPREILSGFMLALRAPQGDYQVAREFLTGDLSAQWNPDAGTIVRTGTPERTDVSLTDTDARIDYTVTMVADINERGRYREVADTTRTLEFAFVLENGQWRISEAPDGTVVSEAAFSRAFTEAALYFLDPSGRYLVPDVRWFATRTTTANRIVEELLRGPSDWLQRVVVTEFPVGTTLGAQGVELRSGQAIVDLSTEAGTATADARAAMSAQLAATLGVASVSMSAASAPLTVPDGVATPLVDPQPSGTVLIGTGDAFGFGTDAGIVAIEGVSTAVVADGASAVTLSHDQLSAVYRGGDGAVRSVSVGDEQPVVLDDRADLVAPSLDPFGFVWSASGAPGGAIEAIALDGAATALAPDGLPADAAILAIDVSRDGSRVVVAASSSTGTRLLVYGVVRSNGVPASLSGPLELLSPDSVLLDVSWVDDRSVVVLGGASTVHAVLLPLTGPAVELGAVAGGTEIVGGRDGRSGIRALAGGRVLAAVSSGGWTDTGIAADFLGTQQ